MQIHRFWKRQFCVFYKITMSNSDHVNIEFYETQSQQISVLVTLKLYFVPFVKFREKHPITYFVNICQLKPLQIHNSKLSFKNWIFTIKSIEAEIARKTTKQPFIKTSIFKEKKLLIIPVANHKINHINTDHKVKTNNTFY